MLAEDFAGFAVAVVLLLIVVLAGGWVQTTVARRRTRHVRPTTSADSLS